MIPFCTTVKIVKTLSEQLACAKREFSLRSNTYPKWIESKRMKPEAAQHEIECMTCIVMTLEKMIMLGEVSEEMKAQYRKDNLPVPTPEREIELKRQEAMHLCQKCGKELADANETKLCPECHPKQCLCCGADIDKGTKCENCEEPVDVLLL